MGLAIVILLLVSPLLLSGAPSKPVRLQSHGLLSDENPSKVPKPSSRHAAFLDPQLARRQHVVEIATVKHKSKGPLAIILTSLSGDDKKTKKIVLDSSELDDDVFLDKVKKTIKKVNKSKKKNAVKNKHLSITEKVKRLIQEANKKFKKNKKGEIKYVIKHVDDSDEKTSKKNHKYGKHMKKYNKVIRHENTSKSNSKVVKSKFTKDNEENTNVFNNNGHKVYYPKLVGINVKNDNHIEDMSGETEEDVNDKFVNSKYIVDSKKSLNVSQNNGVYYKPHFIGKPDDVENSDSNESQFINAKETDNLYIETKGNKKPAFYEEIVGYNPKRVKTVEDVSANTDESKTQENTDEVVLDSRESVNVKETLDFDKKATNEVTSETEESNTAEKGAVTNGEKVTTDDEVTDEVTSEVTNEDNTEEVTSENHDITKEKEQEVTVELTSENTDEASEESDDFKIQKSKGNPEWENESQEFTEEVTLETDENDKVDSSVTDEITDRTKEVTDEVSNEDTQENSSENINEDEATHEVNDTDDWINFTTLDENNSKATHEESNESSNWLHANKNNKRGKHKLVKTKQDKNNKKGIIIIKDKDKTGKKEIIVNNCKHKHRNSGCKKYYLSFTFNK